MRECKQCLQKLLCLFYCLLYRQLLLELGCEVSSSAYPTAKQASS